MGDSLMKGLIVFYVTLACVYGYELNFPKMSYWIGAAIISTSVLWMR